MRPGRRAPLPPPAAFGAAGAAGALLVALLDAGRTLLVSPDREDLLPALLALGLLLPALGLLGGIAAGALLHLLARLAALLPLPWGIPARLALLIAGLAAAPLFAFVRSVFSGPRASRMSGRALIEGALLLSLLGALAAAARLLPALRARPRARVLVGLTLLPALGFLHWADGALYIRTYGQIHAALALTAAGLAALAAGCLGLPRILPRPRLLLPLAVLALAGVTVALARSGRLRWTLRERAPVAGKVVRAADRLLRAAPGPAPAELLARILPGPDPGRADRRDLLDRVFPPRHNAGVLLITVDCLRPDRMGLYGDPRGATPNIDALGRESVHFPRTRAQYPGTRISIASLLRSVLPECTPEYRASFRRGSAAGAPAALTGRLRGRGYSTALFTAIEEGDLSHPERFRLLTDEMDHVENLFRGTDVGTSRPVARAALGFLKEHGPGRVFLWAYFNEAHDPYHAIPEFPFGDSREGRYLSEIAEVDAAVGLLVGGLRAEGLLDRMVVILHSDHGEEFGEHGGYLHLTTTYEEQIRVPLLFRVPGLPPAAARAPAALLDVVPTLLEILDLPGDPAFHGRSLVPQLLDPPLPLERPVFSQVDPFGTVAARLRAVVLGSRKMILDLDSGTREVYDLARDPKERTNLAGRGEEAGEAELAALLSAFVDLPCTSVSAPDEEELDRLAAGYGDLAAAAREHAIERAARAAGPASRRLLRRAIALGASPEILQAADWLLEEEDPEAVRILIDLLDSSPEPARRAAAALALGLHRRREGLTRLRAATADPDPSVRAAGAFALVVLDEPVEEALLLPFLSLTDPVQVFFASLALALLGHDESGAVLAEGLLRRVNTVNRIVLEFLDRHPRPELLPSLLALPADFRRSPGIRARAVEVIGRIDHPDAIRALARLETRPSRLLAERARRLLEARAASLPPGVPDLAGLRSATEAATRARPVLWEGDAGGAEALCRQALAADPGDVETRILLAQILWNRGEEAEARAEVARAAASPGALLPGPGAAGAILNALEGAFPPAGEEGLPVLESVEMPEILVAGDHVYPMVRIRNPGPPRLGPAWRGGLLPRWSARDAGGEAVDGIVRRPIEEIEVFPPGTTLLEGQFRAPRRPGVHEISLDLVSGDRTLHRRVLTPVFVLHPGTSTPEEALHREALAWEIGRGPETLRRGAEASMAVPLVYQGSLLLPGGDAPGSLSLLPVFRGQAAPAGPPVHFPPGLVERGTRAEVEFHLRAPEVPGVYDLDLRPALLGIGGFEPVPWTRVEVPP